MPRPLLPVPVMNTKFDAFQSHDFGGGYITLNIDTDIPKNALSAGQNMDINGNSPEKRKGHLIYGSVSGYATGILGLLSHEPSSSTAELLRVYNTVVERYVSGIWTPLTGASLTTNLPIDSAYFPLNQKTYIINGTDNVVKYASGGSADQTDSSFKKGLYICQYKNRLIVAGIVGQENYFWYTDLGVDTFSSNNYVQVDGAITGLKVIYDKLLIFTKNNIYICQNFSFNGAAAGPESVIPMRGNIGLIAHRSWHIVGNIGYFLAYNAEGIAAIYATDGTTISNTQISVDISTDFANLAPNQLSNACSGLWGKYYRLSVTPSGQTTNTLEYTYDTTTKQQRWVPPYTNTVGGFSCYVNFTVNGQRIIFAGSQSAGIVYQLNQVFYDEQVTTSFSTGQNADGAVDANPAKRCAQSFKIPTMQSPTYSMTGVFLLLKKNAGTTTGLTARIETNAGGVPSGVLANASLTGTISAITSTSYAYYTVKFATPAALSTNTTYWLVLEHTTEGTGSSQYFWGYNGSGGYTSGNGATYASSAWTAQSGIDFMFGVTIEGDIDGYCDTAALLISPIGQKYHLRDLFVDAEAVGNYTIQVGVNTGDYSSFQYQDMSVESNGPIFGSTLIIGTSVLGGQLRSEERIRWDSIRGYILKIRFRNRFANQPFKVYGIRTRHEVLPKIK